MALRDTEWQRATEAPVSDSWFVVTHEPRVRDRVWRGERGRVEVEPTGMSLSDWRKASGQAAKRARRGQYK